MQSQILHPSLQWHCLLLVFMVISVAATPEEGTILRNWLHNITSSSNMLASWRNNSTNPCSTNVGSYGISCGNSNNVLILQNGDIQGPLVPELGQLSHLTSLQLNNNTLTGTIPQEFGNLSALTYLSLSLNYLNGSIPSSLGKLTKLEHLNLAFNEFFGSISPEFGNLLALTYLDLSRNNLFGLIPASLSKLTKLEYMFLNSNVLSGSVPQGLGSLPALTSLDLNNNRLRGPLPFTGVSFNKLKSLDLSFNNFSGSYPESLANFPSLSKINLNLNNISGVLNVSRILELLNTTGDTHYMNQSVNLMYNNINNVSLEVDNLQILSTIAFRLEGNPYCVSSPNLYDDLKRCLCQQDFLCYLPNYPKSSPSESHTNSIGMLIGIISGIVFLLAILLGVIIMKLGRRKPSKMEVEYKQKFAELEVLPQPFLYKVLRVATLDFNESTKLGEGAFGTVYKGTLLYGNEVAIKKLKPRLAAQGEVDDFLNEVSFITKMKHPNLVNLKGYCICGKERMLVYEYIENMDVEQSLLLGGNMEAMTWPVRFNICLGVAQGLHYLHDIATPRVIHRDIKASNILLGAQYEPKIGDFGLALLFPDNETHISLATIAGTKGYLAPEYAFYGQLSEKSDIYSFGVLCLEIVSGRKNIDQSKPPSQVYLATWAWSLYEKKGLKDLIDPSLHLHVGEVKKALHLINIALSCLQQFPQRRPSMNDVQSAMQGNINLDEVEPFPLKEMINFDIIVEDTTPLNSLSIEVHT